jgi:rhodanese-related sulfurtransferase
MLLAAVAVLMLVPAWAGDTVRIGQETLLEKMTSGEGGLLILDVRTAKEFAEGHVPGAVNIPHDELASRLPGLEAQRGSDVVVYCRSGRRAEIALDLLAKAGFERLSHLEGDFLAWSAADRPVETPTPPVPAPAVGVASPAAP